MMKLGLSLSVELRTGMPVREERFFTNRAIACATLESSCPFTEKWNEGPMGSHPSPNLTEAGMGMTESVVEVWAGNTPLKMKQAINIPPNILVVEFFISVSPPAAGFTPKTIFVSHTMVSHIWITIDSPASLQHLVANYGYCPILLHAFPARIWELKSR